MTRLHYANTADGNMLYMVGKKMPDPFFFLVHDGKRYVFLSATDFDAYEEQSSGDVEAIDVGPLLAEASRHQGDLTANLAVVIIEKYKVTNEISVPPSFPVQIADMLRANDISLVVDQLWAPERLLKSEKETAAITQNFKDTLHSYVLLEQILKDSVIVGDTLIYDGAVLTSEFLKREVSKVLLNYDLENTAGIIISCGVHASMPHHGGAGPIAPRQTIIADIFPQSSKNNYFADMTRTYVKGEPSDEIVKMYEAVREAQEASLSALQPGKSCKEIYEISADMIRSHGFDVGEKGYIHSLGHGLGVDIHEAPRVSGSSETILAPGHVITIEPGLYYADIGGVRIEDTVVITEEGHKNLTNFETNWIIP
ncbi:MAG: Xaa-Pro aminopeptidase [Candidatus Azotimanducaceae bacterium]|jgi:Xaa-Pro aminopeptidase